MCKLKNVVILVILLYEFCISCGNERLKKYRYLESYTNRWSAKIIGHTETAYKIAKIEGFKVVEVSGLPDVVVFEVPNHPLEGKFQNEYISKKLQSYSEVLWVEQVGTHKTETRKVLNRSCPRPGSLPVSRYVNVTFNVWFWKQWYMHDCRVDPATEPIYDINVVPVWFEYKLFGEKIVVIIVDDGLETDHPDLYDNYDPKFGYDVIDNDEDPNPVNIGRIFRHGTKCAGVIGMAFNENLCGIGVAPLVTLGAVRLLSTGVSSDLNDGAALAFRMDEIHISSNSWGPTDDGMTMVHMGEMTRNALVKGATQGRQGKGVIYIFAAGNGKVNGDMCGCDPFVSSIYTIAVASSNQLGQFSIYSERCASIMATAYSGDRVNRYNVVATDFGNDICTDEHSGTSAAAPLLAGGVGLTLEANPNLTAREVQYILVMTSQVAPLQNNKGWQRNKAGFWVSHDFGFGMINIFDMVTLAKNFIAVPPVVTCVQSNNIRGSVEITQEKGLGVQITTKACENTPNEVNFLEHVELEVSVDYSHRGDLEINLISPLGTVAHMLEARRLDRHPFGIHMWHFDSVQTWGETAKGTWTVEFLDKSDNTNNKGILRHIGLIFHGTKKFPEIYTRGRQYYDFNLPDDDY